MQTDAAHS